MLPWFLGSIIVSIIIFVGLCFLHRKFDLFDWNNSGEYFCGWMGTFVVTLIIVGITAFFTFVNGNIIENTDITKNKAKIISIQDNISVEGRYSQAFTIGSGYINGHLYYYALTGNQKDGYVVQEYKASDIHLFPENVTTPYYIEKYHHEVITFKKNIIFGFLFKPMKDFKNDTLIQNELHLPKNYVKMEYNIDLK
jgi:hypothetical protein